jgi:hypothetical protein
MVPIFNPDRTCSPRLVCRLCARLRTNPQAFSDSETKKSRSEIQFEVFERGWGCGARGRRLSPLALPSAFGHAA